MLAVAGLVLQGCGGDDDAYMISAEDQARIDQLMADLEEAEEDLEAANERADEAEGEIETLEAMIGMMGDAADPEGSLYAQLNAQMAALAAANAEVERLNGVVSGLRDDLTMTQGDLATANTEVGRLNGVIGMDPDDDDPNGSGLRGELAMANADLMEARDMVADLEEELGRMPSGDDGGSGLRLQLANAQAEVARLMGVLGMMADDEAGTPATGLYKTLADAEADRDMYMNQANQLAETLGMEATDDTEATGLYKMLADAEAMRDMYKDMIGSTDDDADEDGSLHAQLNAKQAEIDRLTMELAEANKKLSDQETADQKAANRKTGNALETAIAGNRVLMNTQQRDRTGDGVANADDFNVDTNADDTDDRSTELPFIVPLTGTDTQATAARATTPSPHPISISANDEIIVTVDDTGDSFKTDSSSVDGRWHDAILTRENGDGNMEQVGVYVSRGDDTVDPTDYVYFGWWLAKDDDGEPAMVEGFANGNNPALAANLPDSIEGEASYKGPAAGKYVTRILSAGDHVDSEFGHFSAEATLTADFGNATDEGLVDISGQVDDFDLSGDTNGSGWVVTLDTPAADAAFATSLIVGGTTHVTIGNRRHGAVSGAWQGQFYDPDTVSGNIVAPGSIAGTFDAVVEDVVSITGAFGAHKE